MKLSTIASGLAFASAAAASPLQGCLTQQQGNTIVNKFISILEDKSYNGQSANATAEALIANDYVEISDSILSLEEAPLGGESATSKSQWISEVLAHPDVNVQTNAVVVGCNQIVWYWTFPNVGTGQYEVKGFNLLDINNQYQVCRAYIEFNSIAWSLDTHEGPCTAPNTTASS